LASLEGLDAWVFFFQAEDGIRDLTVTGVQTCALPICSTRAPAPPPWTASRSSRTFWQLEVPAAAQGLVWNGMLSMAVGWFFLMRSEERRVGKECRPRRRLHHAKGAGGWRERLPRICSA